MRSGINQTVIETPRLYLRELTLDDAYLMYALDNNREVMRFLAKYQDPTETMEDATAIIKRCMAYYRRHPGLGMWATVCKKDHQFVGWTFLKYRGSQRAENFDLDLVEDIEIGYRYFPAFWNRGYCTEMCTALVNYAFHTLQARRIVALVNPENGASIRVLEKLGLRYAGMVEEHRQPAAWYVRHALGFERGGR